MLRCSICTEGRFDFARRFGGISDNDARMFRRSATTLSHLGPAGGFTLVEFVLVTILGALSSVVVLAVSNVSSSASLASRYTVKTTKTGLVSSKPECANISEAACTAAVASVQRSQATRLAQTGKYASNLTHLINAATSPPIRRPMPTRSPLTTRER